MAGLSGCCWQVAAGLFAALFTLLEAPLENRIYLCEERYGTFFEAQVAEGFPREDRDIDESSIMRKDVGWRDWTPQ